MNYQRFFYWLLQIVGWFGLSTVLYLVNRANNVMFDWNRLFLLFVFAVNGIFVSNLLRYSLLRFEILNGKPWRILSFVFVGCAFSAMVFQLFYESLQSILTEHILFGSMNQFFAQTTVMLLVFASWSMVYFVYHYFRAMRKNEMDNLKLAAQKQQIELAFMRSQLNPHFLFNSLTSIRALIGDDPNEAKLGITKLSNLLRNILLYSRREWVTIAEELAFVRDYIDLEKIRFEERLNYQEILDSTLVHLHIPPMTIQSLVENAVKHGINNLKNGGKVEVSIHAANNFLVIEVNNDGCLQQKTETGVGIANTMHRLRESFKGNVQLDLTEINDKVIAKIMIPL